MTRWLFLAHRYIGIALCVLMVAWCISGAVMMYVPYPSLAAKARMSHLEPMDWSRCCAIDEQSIPDDLELERLEIEMTATRALLRLKPVAGAERVIDLHDGHLVTGLSASEATQIAATFARISGCACSANLLDLMDRDQWTVAGHFNAARPLFRFALSDSDGTQLYVSSRDGRIVQVTTARERFWNWVGAIPHWIYFVSLRSNPGVWSQVVIWTSLAGSLLTLLGLYIGVRQLVRAPRDRWSPYRGMSLWHHLPGLMFGLFLLTWVVSGLLSMNPWGLLDSDGKRRAVALLRGAPITGSQIKAALFHLEDHGRLPGVVSIESVPLAGRLYLVTTTEHGVRWRIDEQAHPAPMSATDWLQITNTLGGDASREPGVVFSGDAYYFDRPGQEAALPAYRIIGRDSQHTRYYLDPVTGQVLSALDSNARWHRWLFQGLHTLDFSSALRARPAWDVLMIALLGGAVSICLTGTVLAVRRLFRYGASYFDARP